MQLEFTYQFAEIRESLMPERFAAHPEKYGRRWIRPTFIWVIAGSVWSFAVWESGWIPDRWSAVSENLPHDLRTELLPALIPAFYVCALYGLVIWNTWRGMRRVKLPDASTIGWGGRVARMMISGICALGIWTAISHNWDPIWFPTRKQLVLVAVAPWLVLIVLMQVLGAIQRRGKALGPWRTNPGLRRPKTVILGESRFCMYDAHFRSECEWTYFKRVRETKHLFVLVSEGGADYIIPKRAFMGPAELERCRSLLQNVVPNTRFLVKPIGFAVVPVPVLPLPGLPPQASPAPSLTPQQEAGTMQAASEMELQQ